MTNAQRSRQTPPQLGSLLTPQQTAERLGGIKLATLTDWRFRKKGPPWLKVGRLVRYPSAQLDRWLAEQLRGAA